MSRIEEALAEVERYHEQVVGSPPPPDLPADVPFPPGADPVAFAIEEVAYLRELLARRESAPRPELARVPQADAFATSEGMVVMVDLPGLEADDLTVEVRGCEVAVRGHRRPPVEIDGRPLCIERSWGRFERRFPLPPGPGRAEVKATYRAGVLEIRVARRGEGSDAQAGETRRVDVE